MYGSSRRPTAAEHDHRHGSAESRCTFRSTAVCECTERGRTEKAKDDEHGDVDGATGDDGEDGPGRGAAEVERIATDDLWRPSVATHAINLTGILRTRAR
jgi:hypothetical protein